jgi:hypothetical protein
MSVAANGSMVASSSRPIGRFSTLEDRLMNRSTACAVLAGLLVTVGVGCSDDDEEGATSEPSTTLEATTDDGDGGGDAELAAYCEADLALDQAFSQLGDPDQASLAALAPQVDELLAIAPDELADEVQVLGEAFHAAADDGDFAVFESDETAEADASVHAFDLANCDFTPAPVTAVDYEFTGDLPTEPGVYSLEAENTGEEAHLFVLARLRDGEEGSAEEVFQSIADSPDAEAAFGEHFDELGGPFVTPGANDYALLDLEAGQYVLLCPLGVGSTPDVGFEGDGPPHFTQGMLRFFEIG